MIASGSSESFLFIDSILEKPEGAETVILIVLFIVTTVLTFLYTTATTQTATGPQRYIFLALPILFAPLIISQPAGLGLYWIATNIWSLGQQVVVQRIMPMPTPAEPRGAQGGQDDQAATPAASEEEETSMSDELSRGFPEEPAERVEVLLEEILDALDLDGEIVVDERDGRDRRQGRGRRARAADRPPGPDDRRGAAALLPGRFPRQSASASGSRSMPPAIASAAARRSSARPSAPPSGRWRAARRSSSSR